jgi:hypothetical protein
MSRKRTSIRGYIMPLGGKPPIGNSRLIFIKSFFAISNRRRYGT